jgi:hypothetical protein
MPDHFEYRYERGHWGRDVDPEPSALEIAKAVGTAIVLFASALMILAPFLFAD